MDQLINELKRNLANAEETGNQEWAAALKVRIAQLEKPVKAAAPAPAAETKPAAAKPAAKKTARKKK